MSYFPSDVEHPTLRGIDIHVYKYGSLCFKPSVFAAKRPCDVEIRGTQLTVTTLTSGKKRFYNLKGATLSKNDGQRRLFVHWATGEKISLFANNAVEYEDWIEVLVDSVHWKLQRFYELGKEIGRGAYAVVRRARHKATDEVVAVKIIDKADRSEEDFKYMQREIDIAKSIRHHNIVKTLDIFESERKLYIVLEYMKGGTLQSFLHRHGPLSEQAARRVMKDILVGVEYIHANSVVHRDIKPENMLCSRKTAPTVVKLMDFGLSRIAKDGVLTIGNTENDSDLGPDGLMLTPVGTPGFVAPEVIMTLPYGKEIDIFACGVVMYWILSGRLPFHDTDAQMVMERIKKTDFVFPEEDWKGISKSAMDLVSRMLDRSPYARISASDSLSHPWLAKTVYPSRGDARKERQVETGQGSDA